MRSDQTSYRFVQPGLQDFQGWRFQSLSMQPVSHSQLSSEVFFSSLYPVMQWIQKTIYPSPAELEQGLTVIPSLNLLSMLITAKDAVNLHCHNAHYWLTHSLLSTVMPGPLSAGLLPGQPGSTLHCKRELILSNLELCVCPLEISYGSWQSTPPA